MVKFSLCETQKDAHAWLWGTEAVSLVYARQLELCGGGKHCHGWYQQSLEVNLSQLFHPYNSGQLSSVLLLDGK